MIERISKHIFKSEKNSINRLKPVLKKIITNNKIQFSNPYIKSKIKRKTIIKNIFILI